MRLALHYSVKEQILYAVFLKSSYIKLKMMCFLLE